MTETISVEEWRKLQKAPSKYGNKKIEADGYTFDSKAEETRYRELLLLEAAGQVEDLVLQPSYELQPAFTDAHGRRYKSIRYVGDFSYTEVLDPDSIQGRAVCEDVKGMPTAVFLLKQKIFRFKFPSIDLRILGL